MTNEITTTLDLDNPENLSQTEEPGWRDTASFSARLQILHDLTQKLPDQFLTLAEHKQLIQKLYEQGRHRDVEALLNKKYSPKDADPNKTGGQDTEEIIDIFSDLSPQEATALKKAITEVSQITTALLYEHFIRSTAPQELTSIKKDFQHKYNLSPLAANLLDQATAAIRPDFCWHSVNQDSLVLYLKKFSKTSEPAPLSQAAMDDLATIANTTGGELELSPNAQTLIRRFLTLGLMGRDEEKSWDLATAKEQFEDTEKQYYFLNGRAPSETVPSRGLKIHLSLSPDDPDFFNVIELTNKQSHNNRFRWKLYFPTFWGRDDKEHHDVMESKYITIYPTDQHELSNHLPSRNNFHHTMELVTIMEKTLSDAGLGRSKRKTVSTDIGIGVPDYSSNRISIRYGSLTGSDKDYSDGWEDSRDRDFFANLPPGITQKGILRLLKTKGLHIRS